MASYFSLFYCDLCAAASGSWTVTMNCMVECPALEIALITGAAGFVGSHLADRLLEQGHRVIGIDNLSRGTRGNLEQALRNPAFCFFEADLGDLTSFRRIVAEFHIATVWHMAANSDIRGGIADPNVDFRDTFQTTFNTLLVMREAGIPRIAFASTSAVYGVHEEPLSEDTGPLFPISNYGAMKLGSEALISAALESFLERAWIFRFPNVIGPRATHGIIFDLISKLRTNPPDLEVLGDGTQQKPYLHISDLLDAMCTIYDGTSDALNYFNIGPPDEGTTVLSIAQAVLHEASPSLPVRFTGGNKGWAGDVPRFRYSIEKIKRLGWQPKLTSMQAVDRAVAEVYREIRAGRS